MQVLQMVVKYAALDMEKTKDGSVLCALMHVSCGIRAAVMHQFASPLPLFQCAVTPQTAKKDDTYFYVPPSEHEVDLPPHFIAYLMAMLQWASVPDFALRKHVNLPQPAAPTEPWEVLTTKGQSFAAVHLDVTYKPDMIILPNGKRTTKKEEPNIKTTGFASSINFSRKGKPPLASSHVYEAVRRAMHKIRQVNARGCHPYQLALQGSLSQVPTTGVVFIVKLRLNDGSYSDMLTKMRWEKTLQFDSLATPRDKRGYPIPQRECP